MFKFQCLSSFLCNWWADSATQDTCKGPGTQEIEQDGWGEFMALAGPHISWGLCTFLLFLPSMSENNLYSLWRKYCPFSSISIKFIWWLPSCVNTWLNRKGHCHASQHATWGNFMVWLTEFQVYWLLHIFLSYSWLSFDMLRTRASHFFPIRAIAGTCF